MVCTVVGCDRPAHGRGLCGRHYDRAYDRGELPPARRAPNGSGYFRKDGRVSLGTTLLHRRIVEAALGIALPPGAEIHHVDGDPTNNAHANLVVCQDRRYHVLLHLRAAALAACGNANYRRCVYCHRWDDPALMVAHGHGRGKQTQCHPPCRAEYHRQRRAARKVA